MIVVDTNVIAYLWLPSDLSRFSEMALKIDSEWVAPPLWKSEIRNILYRYIKCNYISITHAIKVMKQAESFIKDYTVIDFSKKILKFSENTNISQYDAEFIVAAYDLKLPLVTSDKKLLYSFPKITKSLRDFVIEENLKNCSLEKINLSKDAKNLIKWFNDKKISEYMDDSESNKVYTNKDINLMIKDFNEKKNVYYAFNYNSKLIGYASIYDINQKKAEFSFLIGNLKFQGLGFGKILLNLLIDKACKIGIKELYCTVNLDNIASIKCMKSFNFKGNILKNKNEWYFAKKI